MINKTLIGTLLISAVVLSGCATMTPEECQVADWQAIGYNDGQNGYDSSRLNAYEKDCGEAGFSVDRKAWQHGQQLGLKLYCAPENGYRVGLAGETYHGVCASEQFVKQYNLGHQTYQRNERIKKIDAELEELDRQLDASDSGDSDKRKRLEEKRKRLVDERNGLLNPKYQFSFEF